MSLALHDNLGALSSHKDHSCQPLGELRIYSKYGGLKMKIICNIFIIKVKKIKKKKIEHVKILSKFVSPLVIFFIFKMIFVLNFFSSKPADHYNLCQQLYP